MDDFLPELLARLQIKSLRIWIIAAVAVAISAAAFYFFIVAPPSAFPPDAVVSIPENSTLKVMANILARDHVIRSPFWFRVIAVVTGEERRLKAGEYLFASPVTVFAIAARLARGDSGFTPVRVTFPEGATVKQMSVILEDNLTRFDGRAFVTLAAPKEGHLFPDTYFLPPAATPWDVVAMMENNFNAKIAGLKGKIAASGKTEDDVVKVASILEDEARTTETRRTIAGIIWKRLLLGMPLQVDSPFEYSIGKNTFQLTTADLKNDSPYNTYTHKGLPPTPIGNPGLDALTDALTPIDSPYLYFLSDVRGNIHYAATFSEHLANKQKYLP